MKLGDVLHSRCMKRMGDGNTGVVEESGFSKDVTIQAETQETRRSQGHSRWTGVVPSVNYKRMVGDRKARGKTPQTTEGFAMEF